MLAILIPLNDQHINGKRDFHIWDMEEADIDTFRVPKSARTDAPVAFWWAGVGIVATGTVISPVFQQGDIEDRNFNRDVAAIRFKRIFWRTPIYTSELAKAVRPVPCYISKELLSGVL